MNSNYEAQSQLGDLGQDTLSHTKETSNGKLLLKSCQENYKEFSRQSPGFETDLREQTSKQTNHRLLTIF